jgi:hypothetical protein
MLIELLLEVVLSVFVLVRPDIGTLNWLLQAVQTPIAGVLESHFVTRGLRFGMPRPISLLL